MTAMLQRGGRLLLSPSDLNNFLACEHRTALDLARAARRDHAAADPAARRRADRRARARARARAPGAAARARPRRRGDRARRRRAGGDRRGDAGRPRRDPPGRRSWTATGAAPRTSCSRCACRRTSGRGRTRRPTRSSRRTRSRTSSSSCSSTPSMAGQIQGRRARAHARGARHRRDALVPPARLPGLRRPRPGPLLPHAAGLPQGRAAAVPLSGRALRLLRLVGALPRPAPRRRPPLARRLAHPRRRRSGSRPRACDGRRAGRRAGRRLGARDLGPRRSPALRQQARLQVESRDSDVPLHERLPGAAGRGFARLPPPVAPATSSSTSRAIRTGATRASSTCSARSPRTATEPLWAHDRDAGARAPSSAGSTGSRRAWSATPTCTSTTTTTTSRPR